MTDNQQNPATGKAKVIYPLDSILEPIRYEQLFATPRPVELELGSGDGSFLVDYAAANPETNFIGIERLLGRLRKIERKANRRGLANVRAIRIECLYFTRYLVPPRSLRGIHVYFPDPWPKRRHRQNRLINDAFPELATRVLGPGGTIFLRTDDRDYFAQMQRVFGVATATFEEVSTPAALLDFKTDFERDFNARGIPTLAAAYRLR